MKVTFKNQVKVLTYHILGSLVMLVILLFIGFEKYKVIGFGVIWVLYSFPVWLLHKEYYLKNKGWELNILDGVLVKSENGLVLKYDFQEIEKVTLYKSASLNKGAPILPQEYYFFARIFLKNGGELIVTCLMSSDLENELKKMKWIPLDHKYVFFASPNLHR